MKSKNTNQIVLRSDKQSDRRKDGLDTRTNQAEVNLLDRPKTASNGSQA